MQEHLMNSNLKKYDPAVDKKILIFVSGVIWSIVGILLVTSAVRWLSGASASATIWLGTAGIILALLIHCYGFSKLVQKNISRILAKEGKVCIFGFQPWKSYFIILIMISMGSVLRSSPLPKQYLSIMYTGFGGAMILSSFKYYRIFFTLK
jgi:uncharacterized membrane protein